MKFQTFMLYLLVMAAVTYLLRAIPFVLVKQKIKNRFLKSFLYYIPYTVLAAMVFPSIFYATGSIASAAIGFAVAVTLSFLRKSLLTVAAASCVSVLAVELVLKYCI